MSFVKKREKSIHLIFYLHRKMSIYAQGSFCIGGNVLAYRVVPIKLSGCTNRFFALPMYE